MRGGLQTYSAPGDRASAPVDFDTLSTSRANLFVQGLVITILNPKSLIFIVAFLPQFIDTTRPLGLQFMVIVPTFLMITFVVTSVWALVAGKARGFLQSQRVFRAVLRGAGGLMIMAGLALALARRSLRRKLVIFHSLKPVKEESKRSNVSKKLLKK